MVMYRCNFIPVEEKDVDRVRHLASKMGLMTEHKIGIYGKIKQHEIMINTNHWMYSKFVNKVNNLLKEDES